jgi:hypothetical protein
MRFSISYTTILRALFLIFTYSAQAQAPSVSINCNTPGCTNVEPGISQTYSFTPNNPPGNGYTLNAVVWETFPGGSAFPNSSPSNTFTTSWNNVPNTPAVSLRVRLTYVKPGLTDIVVNGSTSITVRFLGALGPMTVSGSTPGSINNGGSGVIGCGQRTLSVSLPTPTTSPVAPVTYFWTYPSGWSGPATTTAPNATVTTSVGTGGNITVTARRNDCTTFSQTFIASFTRPVAGLPTISGPTGLCIGSSASFTGSSVNATSFTWSTSAGTPNFGAGLTINSGQNTSSISATGSGASGSSGSVKLTLTANNACQIPATGNHFVNVGGAFLTSNTVNGVPSQSINYVSGSAQLSSMSPNATTFAWSVVGGSGTILPNGPNCSATPNNFLMVRVTPSNSCGSGGNYIYYLQKIGGYPGAGNIYPNPATNVLFVQFDADTDAANTFESYTLRSEKMGIVKMAHMDREEARQYFEQNEELSIDVSSLPRGKYYLTLMVNGRPQGRTIILE